MLPLSIRIHGGEYLVVRSRVVATNYVCCVLQVPIGRGSILAGTADVRCE